MHRFFVKNKKPNDPLTDTAETHPLRRSFKKRSIDNNSNENRNKLVVTMISPWQAPIIIGR